MLHPMDHQYTEYVLYLDVVLWIYFEWIVRQVGHHYNQNLAKELSQHQKLQKKDVDVLQLRLQK